MDSNSDEYAQKEAAYREACVKGAEMGSGMAGAALNSPHGIYYPPAYRPYGHFETAEQQLRAAMLQIAIQYGATIGATSGEVVEYAVRFLEFIKGADAAIAPAE